jgi:hypothetical protein
MRVSHGTFPTSINQIAKQFFRLNHSRKYKYYAINYQEEYSYAVKDHPSTLASVPKESEKIFDSNTHSTPVHTLLKSAT